MLEALEKNLKASRGKKGRGGWGGGGAWTRDFRGFLLFADHVWKCWGSFSFYAPSSYLAVLDVWWNSIIVT